MAAIRNIQPKADSITFNLTEITPDIASAWLQTLNTNNRRINARRVGAMAHDMTQGSWKVTPDLIAFDCRNVLVNGQHRLAAIVESGVTIELWVMSGLPVDSFEVTDDVRRRSLVDYLVINGVPRATNISGLVSRIDVYRKCGDLRSPTSLSVASRATTTDLIKLFHTLDLDHLVEACRAGERLADACRCAKGGAVFASWLLWQVDADDLEHFIKEVQSGTGHGMVLRETMMRDRASGRPTYSKDAQVSAAYVIKAWNAWRSGEEPKRLYWRRGGGSPEAFPTPI